MEVYEEGEKYYRPTKIYSYPEDSGHIGTVYPLKRASFELSTVPPQSW